jgi:hypothetical protein
MGRTGIKGMAGLGRRRRFWAVSAVIADAREVGLYPNIDSSQEEGMCGSRCCEVSIGRYRGWIGKMKVARMQISRMYTY